MNKKITKKLNGWDKAPKDRFFLLSNGLISQEEFLLCEFAIAICDWDMDHEDNYGTFEATNGQIAEILGWKSASTVSRLRKSLTNKGFFIVTGDRTKVKDFDRWRVNKRSCAKTHSDSANSNNDNANLHKECANLQDIQPQKPVSPLGSYKDSVGFFRSDQEYQRIYEEMGSPLDFTIEDMKWIDINVRENPNVPN